jgi:hypothetical protein
MTPVSLRAFLHEHRITFPVAVDRPQAHGMPVTMQTDGLTGTPSMLIIDKAGNLRADAFGTVDELALGAPWGLLLPIRGTRVWWCRGGR